MVSGLFGYCMIGYGEGGKGDESENDQTKFDHKDINVCWSFEASDQKNDDSESVDETADKQNEKRQLIER